MTPHRQNRSNEWRKIKIRVRRRGGKTIENANDDELREDFAVESGLGVESKDKKTAKAGQISGISGKAERGRGKHNPDKYPVLQRFQRNPSFKRLVRTSVAIVQKRGRKMTKRNGGGGREPR